MPNVSPLPSRTGSIDFAASPPLVESPINEDGPAAEAGEKSRAKGFHIPSPVERGVEKVAGMGVSALQRPLQDLRDAQLKGRVKEESNGEEQRPRRSLRDEHDLKGEPATVPQPDESMRAKFDGLGLNEGKRDGQNDPAESEQTGDAVIRAARYRDADMRALLVGKEGVHGHAATADGTLDLATRDFAALGHEGDVGAAPEQTGALMLDMSGYKVPEEKRRLKDKSAQGEQEIEGPADLVLDESALLVLAGSLFSLPLTELPSQKRRRTSSRSRRRFFNRPTRRLCATSSRTKRRRRPQCRPSRRSTSTTPRPSRASARHRPLVRASVLVPALPRHVPSSCRSSTRFAPRPTPPRTLTTACCMRLRRASRSRRAVSSTSLS